MKKEIIEYIAETLSLFNNRFVSDSGHRFTVNEKGNVVLWLFINSDVFSFEMIDAEDNTPKQFFDSIIASLKEAKII